MLKPILYTPLNSLNKNLTIAILFSVAFYLFLPKNQP